MRCGIDLRPWHPHPDMACWVWLLAPTKHLLSGMTVLAVKTPGLDLAKVYSPGSGVSSSSAVTVTPLRQEL